MRKKDFSLFYFAFHVNMAILGVNKHHKLAGSVSPVLCWTQADEKACSYSTVTLTSAAVLFSLCLQIIFPRMCWSLLHV